MFVVLCLCCAYNLFSGARRLALALWGVVTQLVYTYFQFDHVLFMLVKTSTTMLYDINCLLLDSVWLCWPVL